MSFTKISEVIVMNFKYRLSGLGWANGFIEANSQRHSFTISYLNDGLGDFLYALMELNLKCVPNDEVKSQTSCIWYAEPAGTKFEFNRTDEWLNIKVISYEDIELNINEKVEMDTSVLYDELLFIVIKDVDLLLKTHGIVGYRETWYEHDFPLSTFLKLKGYLLLKSKYSITSFEEMGWELQKSELKEDLNLLFKDL
nr:hypothetical protein [Anaerobacillus isosaccharinicus]